MYKVCELKDIFPCFLIATLQKSESKSVALEIQYFGYYESKRDQKIEKITIISISNPKEYPSIVHRT